MNNQKTNFVINNIVRFPLSAVVGAVTLGGAIPWKAIADWAIGFLPLIGM